jgi:hypothetical protein
MMIRRFSRTRRALHPWPKPPGGPHYSVCHFCDTLHDAEPLPEGTAARCKCCGAVLYQNRPASLVRVTAFSITALILMVVVHTFPFLVMDAASIRTTLNLASAANALIHQGSFHHRHPAGHCGGLDLCVRSADVRQDRAGCDSCGEVAE